METMKTPGPDHPIEIKAHPRRVRAHYQNHVVADSSDVLALIEAGYHRVFYFPRADVSMEYFSRTDRDTYCPYKGHAAYFTLVMDGAITENAAWTYESPYPAMSAIEGRIAFFPNAVDVQEGEATASVPAPGEVVRHTDAGAGASQAEPWPTNAPNPDTAK